MRVVSYEFGKVVVDGETYTSDVVIYPGRVEGGWRRKEGHRLDIDDLAQAWAIKPTILVVGTGFYGNMIVPEETLAFARSQGIVLRPERTPDAIATFNRITADPQERVVGALHLTC